MAGFHHVELWVPDLAGARPRWAWLLGALGWVDHQDWPTGHSWRAADGSYLVIEQSAEMVGSVHQRKAPGLNHLAVNGSRSQVEDIVRDHSRHGWQLLFPDLHPFAGGPDHEAAFLSDRDGYEVEVVVGPTSSTSRAFEQA